VVLSDATATDDMDLQEPELMVLRKGFARVMTAPKIIERLNADARQGAHSTDQ
jgi:hypothetical protein